MTPSTDLFPANKQSLNGLRARVDVNQKGPENDEDPLKTLKRTHDALTELHALLEDYSPMWFTQEQHERTEEALRELKRLIPSCPSLSVERTP